MLCSSTLQWIVKWIYLFSPSFYFSYSIRVICIKFEAPAVYTETSSQRQVSNISCFSSYLEKHSFCYLFCYLIFFTTFPLPPPLFLKNLGLPVLFLKKGRFLLILVYFGFMHTLPTLFTP